MTIVPTPRRGFLGRATAAVLGLAAVPSLLRASERESLAPDESWLQGLTGKHRQFFDVSSPREGRALARVANFLDGYIEAYGMRDSDLNAVVGTHSGGLALVFNDAIWSKYEFGKRYSENDPVTGVPSIRNPYGEGWAFSVDRLQKRGVRFIACARSIRRLSADLARDGGRVDEVRAELMANLLPGVTAVPAMVVAGNRAQEAGLTYVFLG
jgi:intracellular sulfur oxidation DsrE/DsrF family protein